MQNTTGKEIDAIVKEQHESFIIGKTRNIEFRRDMLKKLLAAFDKWEHELAEALWKDLHKSYEEAYITEFSIVRSELKNHIRHIRKWTRPKRKPTPLKMFPSVSYVVSEPLGNALIIAPWNYPVQLLLNPLVGAISAGCTAILKPSPYVPNVSDVIERMITETFLPEYVAVVQGNRVVNKLLLEKRFDIIFFTGSPMLGRKVMEAAARNLTSVILELGGKSPCVVDEGANIEVAAKRIAWGKTLNAGQTCIAPDYLIIHRSLKDEFVHAFERAVRELYGEDIAGSRHYVRMVNDAAFTRVKGYLNEGKILYGGRTDAGERFIEPTLLDMCEDLSGNAMLTDRTNGKQVLKDEIFGPVLPILTFEDPAYMLEYINSGEKPLALYYFGKEQDGWKKINYVSSGGACINDTIMHIANENVPFGGVGNSGMGKYHGEESLNAFSHKRSVVSTPTWLDLPFRYMPYKMFGLIKKIL